MEKNACVFRIPYGVRDQVSFGRYSQSKAYTFYLRNEVSRGECWAVSVELWYGKVPKMGLSAWKCLIYGWNIVEVMVVF